MTKKLAWGILGTGRIAGVFANGVLHSETGTLLAVGSRTPESAQRFGETWKIDRRYGSYDDLLADPDVQAIYISVPHPMHAEWAIKAAEAGKHVLCEKPVALNQYETQAIIEAARRNDVFLMEAFMYRCHPQTHKLVELIHSGIIGDVRVIEASFAFNAGDKLQGRLFEKELGGGGILDVGCYTASMARLIAGAATGKPFADPIKVTASGRIGETGIDEWTIATLAFPNDILAQVFTGVRVNAENVVRIFGSKGSILVPFPWLPGDGKDTTITVNVSGEAEPRQIAVENKAHLYALEADTVAKYIGDRQAPAMSWDDTLGNMRTLDQWRAAIGLTYDVEEHDGPGQTLPFHKRPLQVRANNAMKYGTIPGIDKPVSRLVMGTDNQATWPHAAAVFDDFFERGGNCFDTAYIYLGGLSETMLGRWVKNRGVREQVVIFDKGAHTPHCNPQAITQQHQKSLERLKTDYVDIYMMHRDNPEIPVGEFISVLNEHKDAGTIRAFGASNWSVERYRKANEWAQAHGMTGFVALSNNFSLARMIEPVWAGCIAASDPETRAWLKETGTALMPWSSQARGFFAGRAHPNDFSDEELVRCWYSEDNFKRLARVEELAQKRNVPTVSIALAYVLYQPFPTFPLIGPRQLSETQTSFQALSIDLSPEEVRWLNLED